MLLIKLAFTGAVLFALAFFVLFGFQLWQEHSVPALAETASPMIVLGAQVTPEGTPSVQLAWRLEKALAEYQRVPRKIVVCGAQGVNEPATEASVMRAWLLDRGVQAEDVLVEEYSFNTRQNIAGAIDLLPPGTVDVTIVTSDYHLPRAMQLARDMGLEPQGIGSPIKQEYWLKNHTRETLAWGKYYLNKIIPIDGD